jgi:Tol biopolymer transport system component
MTAVAVWLCGLAVAVVSSLVLAGGGASAGTHGGRIVFVRLVGQHFELFTIRPDRTGFVRLTHDNADDESPGWSPNGRRLLALADGRLVVRSSEGRILRRLRVLAVQPRWSPNGRLIAYLVTRCPDPTGKTDDTCADLWVIRPDGTGRRRLAAEDADPGAVGRPFSWAPDGRRLVYVKVGAPGGLVIVNVADGRKRILRGTQTTLSTDPSWSPDGRWIAFSRQRGPFQGSDLYLVAPDGTKLHRIARGLHISRATWAPDGSRIAYLRALALEGEARWAVVVAVRDGSRPRRLAVTTEESVLLWSPDSSRVLWSMFFHRLTTARAEGRGRPFLVTTGETPDWG